MKYVSDKEGVTKTETESTLTVKIIMISEFISHAGYTEGHRDIGKQ